MAIHMMEISGKIANVVFYRKNKKNFARAAPSKVVRTENMRSRNLNFGIASKNGRILRMMLDGLLPMPKDKSMQSRFSGGIARWMGRRDPQNIPAEEKLVYLDDFEFSDKCRFRQRLRVGLSVMKIADNMMMLGIPAFVPTESIIAPEGTLSVTLQVCVAPMNLAECRPSQHFTTSIEIPYTTESTSTQTIMLPVNTERGTLIITACALRYTIIQGGQRIFSREAAYMPAGVVDARYC